MQKQILAICMLAIVASIGFTAISNNVVFAQGQGPPPGSNPRTDNPSGWGAVSSGSATTDGQAHGQHAADPSGDGRGFEDRQGIGNLAGHPTNVGNFVCSIDPSANGCGNTLPNGPP